MDDPLIAFAGSSQGAIRDRSDCEQSQNGASKRELYLASEQIFLGHQSPKLIGISIPCAALKAVRGQPEATHSFRKGVQVYTDNMKGQDGIEQSWRIDTVLYETFWERSFSQQTYSSATTY
jgi:hypothetical protein